jgi:hypothetical protein
MNGAYDMRGISLQGSVALKLCPCLKGQAGKDLRKSRILGNRFSGSVDVGTRDAQIWAEVRAIERARFAKLPWPVRAIGAMLDFVLRRPSP